MGIRGLDSYIKWKAGNCYVEEPLRNLRNDLGTHFPSEDKLNMLVDGSSFLYAVYSKIGQLCWLYHIDWFGLECEVRDFARQLESYGFRPIFFFKRDYDFAIADDPSELSFIQDRLKQCYEHAGRVYDLIRAANLPNLAAVLSKAKLLSILASTSRTYLKELGYEVQVGVGGKPSLALYAKNPRNKIAAILSDNTDFLVFDLPCPTFRIQNMDFTRGTLEKMDPAALKQKLGVQAQALPVIAALLGDTGIETSDFLKKFWKKHSLTYLRTMRHPDVEKVASFAKDVAKDCVRMRDIAAKLPANYFQFKLDFYNLEPGSEADTTDCEKEEEDGWSQILHFAQEQMTHIPIFRDIYEMLKHCQHQLRDGLEDYAQGTLPVSSELLQPVLRRLYGYLYRERPTLPGGGNQVLVHEYSTAYVEESEGEKLVQPLLMEDNYPPPSVLWKLPADGTLEDWEKRCGLLMAILVPSLWQQKEKCHQVLELLRELPGQLILTVLMVIWFQSDKEYSMYEEMATEGLLWQACWIYKKGGLPNEFQRVTYDSLDATVVHFSNFFGSVSYAICLLLAAVGYPIPWQETMPWKFYHGPIFAYYCNKRADTSTVDDVDADMQKYVAQMKQVISMAC